MPGGNSRWNVQQSFAFRVLWWTHLLQFRFLSILKVFRGNIGTMTCSSRPLAALWLCSSYLPASLSSYYFCPFLPFSFLPSFLLLQGAILTTLLVTRNFSGMSVCWPQNSWPKHNSIQNSTVNTGKCFPTFYFSKDCVNRHLSFIYLSFALPPEFCWAPFHASLHVLSVACFLRLSLCSVFILQLTASVHLWLLFIIFFLSQCSSFVWIVVSIWGKIFALKRNFIGATMLRLYFCNTHWRMGIKV